MAGEREYKRNVSVIQDTEGNNIVLINDIVFKGKRNVRWDDVENIKKETSNPPSC